MRNNKPPNRKERRAQMWQRAQPPVAIQPTEQRRLLMLCLRFGEKLRHAILYFAPKKTDSTPKNLSLGGLVVMLSLALFLLPRTPIVVALVIALMFIVSIPYAWICWGMPQSLPKRTIFSLIHLGACLWLGSILWPKVVISPKEVTFPFTDSVFPNSEFKFRVKNETQSDVYSVTPLFRVSDERDIYFFQMTLEFAAARTDNNQAVIGLACTNSDGTFMFPVITHMFPGEEGIVAIKYTGRKALSMTVEDPKYITLPMATGSAETSPNHFLYRGQFVTPVVGECQPMPNTWEVRQK